MGEGGSLRLNTAFKTGEQSPRDDHARETNYTGWSPTQQLASSVHLHSEGSDSGHGSGKFSTQGVMDLLKRIIHTQERDQLRLDQIQQQLQGTAQLLGSLGKIVAAESVMLQELRKDLTVRPPPPKRMNSMGFQALTSPEHVDAPSDRDKRRGSAFTSVDPFADVLRHIKKDSDPERNAFSPTRSGSGVISPTSPGITSPAPRSPSVAIPTSPKGSNRPSIAVPTSPLGSSAPRATSPKSSKNNRPSVSVPTSPKGSNRPSVAVPTSPKGSAPRATSPKSPGGAAKLSSSGCLSVSLGSQKKPEWSTDFGKEISIDFEDGQEVPSRRTSAQRPTLPGIPTVPSEESLYAAARGEQAVSCHNESKGICAGGCVCKELKEFSQSGGNQVLSIPQPMPHLCTPIAIPGEGPKEAVTPSQGSVASDAHMFGFKVEQAERNLAANKLFEMGKYIILPDSTLRKTLDLMYTTVAMVEVIWVALSVTWPETCSKLSLLLMSFVMFAFHSVFVYWVSRTAILTDYSLEDRTLGQIRRQYARSWLVFDVVTSVPYELLAVWFDWGVYFGFPKLLHVLRIPSLFASANPLRQPPGWVTILKTSFGALWCVNVIAFIFTNIEGVSKDDVNYPDVGSVQLFDQYLHGVYWATITLSSVGFGDIVPTTRWSRVLSIVVIFFSVIILSCITGQIASSVIRLDAFQQGVQEKKSKLYSLMNRYDVPWVVQKGAFSIYPTLLETSLKDYFEILGDLPPFMQDKVILCIKRKIVSQVPLFQGIDESTLTALAAVTQQILVPPYEYVIVEGEVGEEMFFLAQGIVEVLLSHGGAEVCAATLKSGSWFGEIALLRDTYRTASVRSVTACSCFKLQKQDFNGILRVFPEFESKIKESVASRIVEIEQNKVNEKDTESDEESRVVEPPVFATVLQGGDLDFESVTDRQGISFRDYASDRDFSFRQTVPKERDKDGVDITTPKLGNRDAPNKRSFRADRADRPAIPRSPRAVRAAVLRSSICAPEGEPQDTASLASKQSVRDPKNALHFYQANPLIKKGQVCFWGRRGEERGGERRGRNNEVFS